MSTTIISIGGGYNATNSLVPVASKFNASISAALQTYINTLSAEFENNTLNLEDDDVAKGTDYKFGSASGELYETTNTDSAGGVIAGPPIGSPYTVSASATSYVAQEGGDYTVTGSAATTFALLGAYSNVNYDVVDPTAGSIFGAGGSNIISVNYDGSGPVNSEQIFSAGDDTINLNGLGDDSVTAENGANDFVNILSGTATVTADGNSTVQVVFAEHAGANLDFINNSTTAQTVFSGAYTVQGGASVFAPNSVTAFGGAGGGYYVGGLAGNNSLIGGSGVATLQGGGAGDFLSVSGGDSGTGNVLFSGNGAETLIAGSGTDNNLIQLGGPYTGKGDVTTSGVASALGSGTQAFFIGNVAGETITGSTVVGSTNLFDVIGDSTTGGAQFTITDFGANGNNLILFTGHDGLEAGDATISVIGSQIGHPNNAQILLSDGTVITLQGVSANSLTTHNFGTSTSPFYGISNS